MNNSTAKAKPKMTVKNGVVYGDALSAQEKKRIVMQKKKDRKAKKVRKSAQQTIPYVEMCRDGICKVNSRLYTKSIAFEDINYQLAQNEDKTAIFENWCDFLNYFDSSIFVQLSFINQKASLNEFRKRINIPAQEDAFNDIRSEYSGMLQNQLTKGNNGLVKKKYITFGIEADSLRTAKPKLERIETDILNNFKTLGVRTEPLSGYERLKVLHDVFNMDTNEPLQPVEKTIIDRSVRMVYQEFLADPKPEKMPILEDLYNILRNQKEPEAQRIATALEIYVHGSLNVFNHRTNVDVNNRFVCYDIRELGKQLKKLGMLIVQDQVWNRVTINRAQHKATRYYMDEFHLLLKEEQTAAYSVEIWKRFRKWGGIPTGITQNVKDLLASREVENIFENSDFVYLLNQASGDRQILSKALNISPSQQNYITNSNAGEGLIFYGSTIVPFKDDFPKNTQLYRIMTTKPEETVQN